MQRSTGCMVLHADLFVKSMATALDFYCKKLGFTVVDDTILRGPIVESLSRGAFNEVRLVLLQVSRAGALIELQEFEPSALHADTSPRVGRQRALVTFLVAQISAHIDTLQRKGAYPSSEVFVVDLPKRGSCKVVFYDDPDGNQLEFVEVLRQPPR